MKIRTDFVTNSSSSSYIIGIGIISNDGNSHELDVEIGMETGMTLDGEIIGGYVSIDMNESILNYTRQSQSVKELIESIFDTIIINNYDVRINSFEDCDGKVFAISGKLKFFDNKYELIELIEYLDGIYTEIISEETNYLINNKIDSKSPEIIRAKEMGISIISEEDFIRKFSDEDSLSYFGLEYEEEYYHGESASGKEVFSKTLAKFIEECEADIKFAGDIAAIVVSKGDLGTGDTASWIEMGDLNELHDYYNRYKNADKDQKELILSELISLISSEPVWNWKDNDAHADGPRQLVLNGTQEELKKKIMSFLESKWNDSNHWIVSPTTRYVIDLKNGNMKSEDIIILYTVYM